MKTLTEIRNAPLRELVAIETTGNKKGKGKNAPKAEPKIVEISEDASAFETHSED
jgi:hypothetical protein